MPTDATQLTQALLNCKEALPLTFHLLESNYIAHYTSNNLDSYVITSLELCKAKKPPYHEYVLAHVSFRANDCTRLCGTLKVQRAMPTPDRSSPLTVSAQAMPAISSSSKIRAEDTITICGIMKKPPDPVHYRASRFDEGDTCSIHRFIAGGLTIIEHKPAYNPIVEQCYWFAGLLFKLLVPEDAVEGVQEKRKLRVPLKWKKNIAPGDYGTLQLVTPTQLQKDRDAVHLQYLERVEALERHLLKVTEDQLLLEQLREKLASMSVLRLAANPLII